MYRFYFFNNDFLIIKNIEEDLTNIMKQAVKSDIYIEIHFLIFMELEVELYLIIT